MNKPNLFTKHIDRPIQDKNAENRHSYGIITFIDSHNFRSPILFQAPITNKELINPVASPSALIKRAEAHELNLEEYILYKFGKYGEIALAIAKAESGLKEDAYHVNASGSIDIGVFQINSVHFTKKGCSLKELLGWENNVDCAYKIFEANGFSPWTTFKNGAYIEKL